jgi:hypothetical protein
MKDAILYSILILFIIGTFSISESVAQEIEELEYQISGAEVTDIELDSYEKSLTILIDVRARGEITITLPRDLIDAKKDSEDINFDIITGYKHLDSYDEVITTYDRTITIPFAKSNYEITIFGTQVSQPPSTPTTPTTVQPINKMIKTELAMEIPNGDAKLLIYSNTQWNVALQSSSFDYLEISDQGDDSVVFQCDSSFNRPGVFGAKIEKLSEDGYANIVVIQNGVILSQGMTDDEFGDILINGNCAPNNSIEQFEGGCLIATATYGSEMATQVQQLRELRDNTLLQTESGKSFMSIFNNIYYSFSPYIADYERENPVFKEVVKLAITPMISSLSILNYVDMNSESEVLGYGISLIILNLGMYLGIPAVVVIGIRKQF